MLKIKRVLTDTSSIVSLICFVAVTVGAVLYCVPSADYGWYYIIWNYFLAAIPVFFALFAKEFAARGKKFLMFCFSFLWILFFPNSPYMITDLKYISNVGINLWDSTQAGENIVTWLYLLTIVVSVFCGVLVGLLSLFEMHSLIKTKFNGFVCWLFVILVCAISSFGIYIGRFSRVNSWDILQPIHLVEESIKYFGDFTLWFVFIFTAITLLIYIPVYFLLNKTKNNTVNKTAL